MNKPIGHSSAWCTNALKRLGQKKIGHAGTLDPIAHGILIVLLGNATKLSNYIMDAGRKIYVAVAELGRSTDTWDVVGKEICRCDPDKFRIEILNNTNFISDFEFEVKTWIGAKEQLIPPYSATKCNGKPFYALARAGREVPKKTKVVEISCAEVLWVKLPFVSFRVECSSGTYIRSLAHSLGVRFGCGAVLSELTRVYSHPFSLDDSVSLDALLDNPDLLYQKLLPITDALPHLPIYKAQEAEEMLVRNGVPIDDEKLFLVRSGIIELPKDANVSIEKPSIAFLIASNGYPLALIHAETIALRKCWTVVRGLWT